METLIVFSPRVYVLHNYSLLKFNKLQKVLMLNLFVATSLLLAAKWKLPEVPTRDDWLSKVRLLFLMNTLSALIRYRHGSGYALTQFERQWRNFFQYCDSHRIIES